MGNIRIQFGVVYTDCENKHLDWFEEYWIWENDDWKYVGNLLYFEPPKTFKTGYPRAYGYHGQEVRTIESELMLSNGKDIEAGTEICTILYPVARELD